MPTRKENDAAIAREIVHKRKKGGRKPRGETPSPYTTLLVNKVAAFFAAGFGGVHELARFCNVAPPRVTGWITSRQFQPGYEYGKNIEGWLNLKGIELAAANLQKQEEFREAFEKISKEFPHENP